MPPRVVIFLCALTVAVLGGFIASPFSFAGDAAVDALVYIARFAAVFVLVHTIVRVAGAESAEAFAAIITLLLMASSLFVLRLQWGMFHRLYASAMSVASFSQALVVMALLLLLRRRLLLVALFLVFLALTFSRTSILTLLVFLGIYVARARATHFQRVLWAGASLAVVGAVLWVTSNMDAYSSTYLSAVNREHIVSLHYRTFLWDHAAHVLLGGEVPLLGVGLHCTPTLLKMFSVEVAPGLLVEGMHFHSIWIEYGFGLGILAVLPMGVLIHRIYVAVRRQCLPALFVYGVFVVTQTVDYTIYRPKELMIWVLLIGVAESHLRRAAAGQVRFGRPSNGTLTTTAAIARR